MQVSSVGEDFFFKWSALWKQWILTSIALQTLKPPAKQASAEEGEFLTWLQYTWLFRQVLAGTLCSQDGCLQFWLALSMVWSAKLLRSSTPASWLSQPGRLQLTLGQSGKPVQSRCLVHLVGTFLALHQGAGALREHAEARALVTFHLLVTNRPDNS